MDYSRCLVPQGAGKWVVTRKGFQGAAWAGRGGAGRGGAGRGGEAGGAVAWPWKEAAPRLYVQGLDMGSQ